MKEIPLTQGKVALVDDEDYEELSRYRWCFTMRKGARTGYAVRCLWKGGGRGTTVPMHRVIMKAQKGQEVDHGDRSGLNNQKGNLRFVSRRQNIANKKKQSTNTSGYKGVHWKGEKKRWVASIGVNGKRKHIGYYDTKEQAALAYNRAAQEHFGEFACLNEIF